MDMLVAVLLFGGVEQRGGVNGRMGLQLKSCRWGWHVEVNFQICRPDAMTKHVRLGQMKPGFHPRPGQMLLKGGHIHPQVEKRAQEHIAGDSADGVDVQVQCHFRA